MRVPSGVVFTLDRVAISTSALCAGHFRNYALCRRADCAH